MKEKTAKTEIDLELMMETSDLSKAEYNFVCVTRICKDVIKSPLIDVLTHYISPTKLYMNIQSCSMLRAGKDKLSPDQLKRCFLEPPLLPDYKTFDFPLLYKLIRHLCPSLRPTQGWGVEPKCTDTLIGDDIERLRLFCIYMFFCSTRMSDGKFEEFCNGVRYSVRRFQNFTKNWSNYNYEEELKKIVPKKLGNKYPRKEEQLENVQLTLMPSEFSYKKDEPVISIDGAEEAICGSTIRFNVSVKPANTPEWSVIWQKNRTGSTELIDITSRKYSGSHSRQLVINSVEKEDEGKYKAFLSRKSNGKNYKIFSNCIYLLPRKDLPSFDIWNITREKGGITIYYKVLECSPNINKIKWMKNGETLVLRNKKYVGGGLKDGFITITSPTEADRGTYICTVTNAVGSVSRSVTLGPPFVLTSHISNNENRSVRLIGKVSATDKNATVNAVYWSKNGVKIDIEAGGRIQFKNSDKNRSLTIHNVNDGDAGSYRLTAISSAGSNESEIHFGVPEIFMERRGNPDGSQCFTAKIKSIPEAYHVQWKVKKNDEDEFSLVDVNDPDYEGTSNSLKCPVLVVKKKELLEIRCFHIKVDNFIGSSIKEILDKPIRYFFYKPAQDFDHFHYVYNLIRECKSRVEKIHLKKKQKISFMSKDVVIKIGIAGDVYEENPNLISRGTWKETTSEDEQIWDVSPLLCFQNGLYLESVLKIVRQISTPHRIIIDSDPICKEAVETADSIIIVGKKKHKIKKIITICLEEPFHQILNEWLEDFRNQGLTELASEIIAEINNIRKYLVFEESENTASVSCLQGAGTKFIVPDNVKDYLFSMHSVNSFGIWDNLSFKVFVKKETDGNRLKKELLNINKNFFDNFPLEIVKRKYVQKKTLKQGDPVMSCIRNESGICIAGTLGGFVRKNDNKRKIYGLTCSHIFPQEKQLAYSTDDNGFKEIGTCVFTTREKACDFAAIELMDSFLDGCDVTVRRDDKKKVNAHLYTKNLHDVGLVHKIGAMTDVTSGRIISYEYYDKEMNNHCRDNIFLVQGINGPFSEAGDSGSLVFCRPKSVIQNHVNVLGIVFAQNIKTNCDGDDDAFNVEDNLSICYRINTALELFKEKQGGGFEVKFQDDLSVNLSSPSLQSLSSEDSAMFLSGLN